MAVTTVDDLSKRLDAVVERLDRLEKRRNSSSVDEELRNRVEDLCDLAWGTNVRPPVKLREPDEYPAKVKPSNEDD